MLIASKKGMLGDGLRKLTQNVDDRTLGTVEHTTLALAVNTMMPGNATVIRKAGIFLAVSVAYNLLLQKVQSSETAGLGR